MSLPVGARISVDKCKATVRYVGSIEGQRGTWVGLDWDDAERGKHDGSTGGRRYFTCSGTASSGSFVREAKLLQVAELGVCLPTAIERRYKEDAGNNTDCLASPAAEIVGLQAIKQQQALVQDATCFTLSNSCIASIGAPGKLWRLAAKLQDLDLANNLLPSWAETARLAQELPELASLDLSQNRMAMSIPGPKPKPFMCLRTLILNHCSLSCQEVCGLAPWLPALEALHLCSNSISTLDGSGESWQALGRLQTLILDDNAISDWRSLRPLYHMSNLRCLSLSGNHIERVPAEELSTGNNHISGWGTVDALSGLKALQELRLSGNPLVQGAECEARAEVIARLDELQVLNATPVTLHERKDSELQYVRRVLGQLGSLPGSEAEALRGKHPRLRQLQDRYGDAGVASSAPSGGTALSSSMLQLSLTHMQGGMQSASHMKRLPRRMQLRQLRQLCAHLFRLPGPPGMLGVKSPSGAILPCEAAEDSVLGDLDLQDGAEILVGESVDQVQPGGTAGHTAALHQEDNSAGFEERLQEQLKVLPSCAAPKRRRRFVVWDGQRMPVMGLGGSAHSPIHMS